MKLFVYEYCCSQPTRGEATARALRDEGLAMLTAIMTDLSLIAGLESIALVADDAPPLPFPCRRVRPNTERRVFRRLAREADYTLVIAPEIEKLLEDRCRLVRDAGGKLLGPDPDAVSLTADKLRLHEHFVKHHIATPATRHIALVGHPIVPDLLPGVLKPRFGVGSLSLRMIRTSEALGAAVEDNPSLEYLLQRHVAGTPASVSFLIGPHQCVALQPARQHLSNDGGFQYQGGSAPLKQPLARRARKLARRAVRCVPGLRGYLGVDLVLGRRTDGTEDYVIEINPRLTTSYIGLRMLTRSNLAETMLNITRGLPVRVTWKRNAAIHWTPKGCTPLAPHEDR